MTTKTGRCFIALHSGGTRALEQRACDKERIRVDERRLHLTEQMEVVAPVSLLRRCNRASSASRSSSLRSSANASF